MAQKCCRAAGGRVGCSSGLNWVLLIHSRPSFWRKRRRCVVVSVEPSVRLPAGSSTDRRRLAGLSPAFAIPQAQCFRIRVIVARLGAGLRLGRSWFAVGAVRFGAGVVECPRSNVADGRADSLPIQPGLEDERHARLTGLATCDVIAAPVACGGDAVQRFQFDGGTGPKQHEVGRSARCCVWLVGGRALGIHKTGTRAINSVVECHLHTVEVSGSNPLSPTITPIGLGLSTVLAGVQRQSKRVIRG